MRKADQQRKRLTKREQRQREPLSDFTTDGKAGYYPAYHAITDYLWLMSGNAWKLVCYVLRHTIGYQQEYAPKRITLDEFEHGRKRRDGSRIDHGTGNVQAADRSGPGGRGAGWRPLRGGRRARPGAH